MTIINLPRDDITVQDLKHANANRAAITPLTPSGATGKTVNTTARQQTSPRQAKTSVERRNAEDRRQQDRRQLNEDILLDTRSSQERRRSNRRKEKHDLKESVKNFNFAKRGIDVTV